ncbi:hypothetical protein [Denitrobacterium detoxificans]|nr:hypothetical protein [Denitrobacterium detoxificans]
MSVLAPGGTAHPKTAAADLLCVTDAKPADARKAVIYQVVLTLWDVLLLGLLALSAANVLSGSFNPFIYFQF